MTSVVLGSEKPNKMKMKIIQFEVLLVGFFALSSCKKPESEHSSEERGSQRSQSSRSNHRNHRQDEIFTDLQGNLNPLMHSDSLNSKDLKLSFKLLNRLRLIDFEKYLEALGEFQDKRVEYNSIRKELSTLTGSQLLTVYNHTKNIHDSSHARSLRRVVIEELLIKNPEGILTLAKSEEGTPQVYLLATLGSSSKLDYLFSKSLEKEFSDHDLKIVARAAYSNFAKLPSVELREIIKQGAIPSYLEDSAMRAFAATSSRDGVSFDETVDGVTDQHYAEVARIWLTHTSRKSPQLAIDSLKFIDPDKITLSTLTPSIAANYSDHNMMAAAKWASTLDEDKGKTGAELIVYTKWLMVDPPKAGEYIANLQKKGSCDTGARAMANYYIHRKKFEAAQKWIQTIENDDIKRAIDSDYTFYLEKESLRK